MLVDVGVGCGVMFLCCEVVVCGDGAGLVDLCVVCMSACCIRVKLFCVVCVFIKAQKTAGDRIL